MAVSVTTTLISEDQLRSLSRNVKQSIPTDCCCSEERIKFLSLVDSLFFTASFPELHGSHRVASWNALCAYIDHCPSLHDRSESDDQGLGQDLWKRGLIFYLDHASLARPKSARQLLVTLTAVVKRQIGTNDRARSALRDAVRYNMHVLSQRNDRAKVRAYASALAQFVSRDILSVHDLTQEFDTLSSVRGAIKTLGSLEQLLLLLFGWITEPELASSTGALVAAILDKVNTPLRPEQREISIHERRPVWMTPLLQVAQSSELDPDALRTHLLPILFSRSVTDYGAFLRIIGIESFLSLEGNYPQPAHRELLLVSLQAGKEAGLLYESDTAKLRFTEEAIFLPANAIASLLYEISRSARLSGLALLITSYSATRPLLRASFTLLKHHLPDSFADTDANFRGEFFSLIQRLLDRLRAVSAVLARQAARATSSTAGDQLANNMLNHHRQFLLWLVKCITWQLRPTAAYQRHISALKCLSIVVRSGVDGGVESKYLSKSAQGNAKWPFSISLHSLSLQRLLLDLAVDPFDDVRQSASDILVILCAPRSKHGDDISISVRRALTRAENKMLATGRADQADGVSHLFRLLTRIAPTSESIVDRRVAELEAMLSIAERNLQHAVDKYPLHGLLTTISRLCDDLVVGQGPLARLVSALHRVWQVVKPVLCDDAPEGYLPEAIEEEVPGVTTKDTLSFCWRALKEASLLLGRLISMAAPTTQAEVRVHNDLHNLCFEQLAELRHRGAFSTVAQTWVLCCGRIALETNQATASPLEPWYERLLTVLRSKTTINTRRSAGLPSLLCGLLIADQHDHLLRRAFEDLQIIARQPVERTSEQESSLIQIHAINCLKDVLKNSKLGEKSEAFLPDALQLAADALRSRAWAVRNCGLMLFRGVIDRLLGTSHAYLDEDENLSKSIIHHQSRLFQVVLGLLSVPQDSDAATSLAAAEGVFPALQLLQRLRLPVQHLTTAKESVRLLLGSSAWHLRDKAARTYASLVDGSELKELRDLLQAEPACHNAWHGQLSCARYIIAHLSVKCRRTDNLADDTQVLRMLLEVPRPGSASSIIQGAWLDVAVEVLMLWQRTRTDEVSNSALSDYVTGLELSSSLQALVEATGHDYHAAHVSRMATARALALSLCVGISVEPSGLRSLVTLLCSRDSDTAADFFNTVCNNLQSAPRLALTALVPVQEACGHVLGDSAVSIKVKIMAQKFLLAVSQRQYEETGTYAVFTRECLHSSLDQREYVDNLARLRLLCLNSATQHEAATGQHLDDIRRLVQDLEAAVDEESYGLPFSREAAAQGLASLPLDVLWGVIRNEPPIRDSLAFIIYDLLHDDDEDIRLLAAKAAARLHGDTGEAMPPVAARRLVPYLLSNSADVLGRAFADLSIPVASSLSALSDPDTALFAEEKQNLYIDTAREVHFWSRCALQLAPETISSPYLRSLGTWTIDGLEALKHKAETEYDGPLGWTSDADTFTLGLRVFYAAELLLSLSRRGKKVPAPPSSIRRLLGETFLAGEKADFNCIWVEEVGRIWKKAASDHLQRVAFRLVGITNAET